ncbi:MAG: ABC transporter, ATP-binding protein [Methanoregula sp. SKADARSKE-2]|nr:MAG: ABC transporter, ATP-binding protein [Methanoregula sp. SKADARSKE-2]
MNLTLEAIRISRGEWSVSAQAIFEEGVHLVSGKVGSGKSTLALVMAGLLRTDSGSVLPRGISSRMVSFQFPEYHLTGSTVDEECSSWGVDPEKVISSVKLGEKRNLPPLSLSRGELKRLHLACILSKKYDLLILDEPFSSLDCREKERVSREISSHGSGITVILSHEQAIFPRVDFIWEIRNGTLMCLGSQPSTLPKWHLAPEIIKNLIAAGKVPLNIAPGDLLEAASRT